MSESELLELKNQLKQEILAEMKEPKPRKETVWSKIKQEFKEEAKMFNYKYEDRVDGRIVEREKHFEIKVFEAIGTLLKLKYKERLTHNIDADYEEVKQIVNSIFEVFKAKVGN